MSTMKFTTITDFSKNSKTEVYTRSFYKRLDKIMGKFFDELKADKSIKNNEMGDILTSVIITFFCNSIANLLVTAVKQDKQAIFIDSIIGNLESSIKKAYQHMQKQEK